MTGMHYDGYFLLIILKDLRKTGSWYLYLIAVINTGYWDFNIMDIERSITRFSDLQYCLKNEHARFRLKNHKFQQSAKRHDSAVNSGVPLNKVEDEAYSQLEPRQKRERTFEALLDLFVQTSRQKPLKDHQYKLSRLQ
jgi:hypothetical protein